MLKSTPLLFSMTTPDIFLILHDIRSAYNVGAIFRTAEAVGVKEIVLCGYTPAPIDRFGRARADIAKAALGAETMVPWRTEENTLMCITDFQKRGIRVIALEQTKDSRMYTTFVSKDVIALVVGNEVEGVPSDVCAQADVCIELPMCGKKESLNVSVATGVMLYHLRFGSV